MVPLISKITERHENAVEKLLQDQRYFLKSGANQERVIAADAEVGRHLLAWGTKLTKLGLKVYGNGFVGFPAQLGYWSWHAGESRIEFWHNDKETPLQRKKIARNPIGTQTR